MDVFEKLNDAFANMAMLINVALQDNDDAQKIIKDVQNGRR